MSIQGGLSVFPDNGKIGEWAEHHVLGQWRGLINDHGDGNIDPAGTTILTQVPYILIRFDQNLVEN